MYFKYFKRGDQGDPIINVMKRGTDKNIPEEEFKLCKKIAQSKHIPSFFSHFQSIGELMVFVNGSVIYVRS